MTAGGLLDVDHVTAGYADRPVLQSISIDVQPGEVVVLIGHNGAGKSTLLKAIFGLVNVDDGRITFGGTAITNRPPSANVSDGLAFIPQGEGVFTDLSVEENLRVGSLGFSTAERAERIEEMLGLFPALRGLRRRSAGSLSGGEQQMVALARALVRRPRLLLVDEPSVGLAPALAGSVMRTLRETAQRSGAAVLLAEQNVREALHIADRVFVLRLGAVMAATTAQGLLERYDWRELF